MYIDDNNCGVMSSWILKVSCLMKLPFLRYHCILELVVMKLFHSICVKLVVSGFCESSMVLWIKCCGLDCVRQEVVTDILNGLLWIVWYVESLPKREVRWLVMCINWGWFLWWFCWHKFKWMVMSCGCLPRGRVCTKGYKVECMF